MGEIQQHYIKLSHFWCKKTGQANYSVKSVKDVYSIIIPHFIKYQILTQKQADFELFKAINILLPIFSKYPLQGTKKFNFMDFCKVVELMKNKVHLTSEGLEEIRKN